MKKQPTEEEIRVAAYYIWQSEGCPNNSDFGDWLKAQENLCKCLSEGKEACVCEESKCQCASKKEPAKKKAPAKKAKK